MSIRKTNHLRLPLAVLGLVMVTGMAIPACIAGGAATIVIDKHQLAPRGSYIPERRVKAVLDKVKEHQVMKQKRESLQQKERLQENKLPKPQSPDEK